MKRLDLVQLAFIIAGICSAFFCLDLIPSFFIYLITWFSEGLRGGELMNEFIITILLLAVYLIFCIYSIRNSKQLAAWVADKANLHGEINLKLGTRDALFTFFTGLAMFGLIRDLPWLFSDIYHFIKTWNTDPDGVTNQSGSNKVDLFTQFCKIGLIIILLIYANVFADFFAARVKNPEPPDEIMEKTD